MSIFPRFPVSPLPPTSPAKGSPQVFPHFFSEWWSNRALQQSVIGRSWVLRRWHGLPDLRGPAPSPTFSSLPSWVG